jgi:hypothetical protein
MCIAGANEEGFTLASDEHVSVFVDGDSGLSENDDGAIITGFTNAHERLWEINKRVASTALGDS